VYDEKSNGRSIGTDMWVRSLVLNIVNTRGRDNTPTKYCTPTHATGGHWSESYREDGLKSGTTIWTKAQYPSSRIQDAINLLKAQLQADLHKLTQMGIASEITVEAEYQGRNKVNLLINIMGPGKDSNVINLVSERSGNDWAWR
jgi:hypothetical protein